MENQGHILKEDLTINHDQQIAPNGVELNQGQNGEPHRIEQQIPRERESQRVVMVNRNQDADEVIHRVRNDGIVRGNNLAAMVEKVMALNRINIG